MTKAKQDMKKKILCSTLEKNQPYDKKYSYPPIFLNIPHTGISNPVCQIQKNKKTQISSFLKSLIHIVQNRSAITGPVTVYQQTWKKKPRKHQKITNISICTFRVPILNILHYFLRCHINNYNLYIVKYYYYLAANYYTTTTTGITRMMRARETTRKPKKKSDVFFELMIIVV